MPHVYTYKGILEGQGVDIRSIPRINLPDERTMSINLNFKCGDYRLPRDFRKSLHIHTIIERTVASWHV